MELILKKDVDNVGLKGDIIKVKDGYGRNYLIPYGHAILATPSAKKVLEENIRQKAHKEAVVVKKAKEDSEKAKELEIVIPVKSGSDGKLFGSVSSNDLSIFFEKNNIILDKKYIKITGGNIKQIGKYNATVRFHREIITEIGFEVIPLK